MGFCSISVCIGPFKGQVMTTSLLLSCSFFLSLFMTLLWYLDSVLPKFALAFFVLQCFVLSQRAFRLAALWKVFVDFFFKKTKKKRSRALLFPLSAFLKCLSLITPGKTAFWATLSLRLVVPRLRIKLHKHCAVPVALVTTQHRLTWCAWGNASTWIFNTIDSSIKWNIRSKCVHFYYQQPFISVTQCFLKRCPGQQNKRQTWTIK